MEKKLWAADPHRYGLGKVHIIDAEDERKTCCGQHLEACPGKPTTATVATCKICLNHEPRRRESEIRREEWQRRDAEREVLRLQILEERRKEYHAYLRTSVWRERSQAVLRRAGYICEGCLKNKATQAHHLTYEHVGNEFLWELRAVCVPCHERWHAHEEEQS